MAQAETKRKNNTIYILVGMVLGMVTGLILKQLPSSDFISNIVIGGVVEVIGTAFTNALKMIIVPLVFVSVVCGMGALKGVREIGRIGIKTFVLYLFTTTIAILISLATSLAFNLGGTLDMSSTIDYEISTPEIAGLGDTLLSIIPTNIFSSIVDGDMLPILFFAIFFGACVSLSGEAGDPVAKVFESLNVILIKMVYGILSVAPICVYCLMTKAIYNVGAEAIWPLIKYFLVFLLVVAIQAFLVYGIIIYVSLKTSPVQFFKKYSKQAALTFSVSSSSALIPVSMDTCKKLGIPEKVYAFSLPLGATINMDGTAIIQAVSVVFLAAVYGLELTPALLLIVVTTGLMISIGSPAVPGGSHITLAVILAAIGIPIEGIALIMGFERLAGMTITVLNVMGDVMCAAVVSKSEKTFDLDQYKADELLAK